MPRGGRGALLDRLADPAARARIAREFAEGLPGWEDLAGAADWDQVRIASLERNPNYLGKSVQAIADALGQHPVEALCDVLREEEGRPTVVLTMMDEGDVRTILAHPLVMIGSDAIIARGKPHPRTWGTYPTRPADLVVFDPATVKDRATYEDPEQPPLGIPHVLVNGVFAVRDGVYTGERAGKVLRA